jgi:hypothetical protein
MNTADRPLIKRTAKNSMVLRRIKELYNYKIFKRASEIYNSVSNHEQAFDKVVDYLMQFTTLDRSRVVEWLRYVQSPPSPIYRAPKRKG